MFAVEGLVPTHTNAWHTHETAAVHVTPQNYVTPVMRWMRWIESFICQMRRGRRGGERGQGKDRCQMCVCVKAKIKYRVQQRFYRLQPVNTYYTNFLFILNRAGLWTGPEVLVCQGPPKPHVQGSDPIQMIYVTGC